MEKEVIKSEHAAKVGAAVKRIRLRKELTLAQVGSLIEFDKSTLSKLENGRQGYSDELLGGLARAFNMTEGEILAEAERGGNADAAPALRDYRVVPVVGTVEGGPDGYLDEMGYPVGNGDGFVEHPAKGRNTYALRVRGESMHPRIRSGEFIVAEPGATINPGDDVVVICQDGRKMVKQLLYQRDGEITLGSINNDFKPITLQSEEVQAMHYVAGILPRGAFCK